MIDQYYLPIAQSLLILLVLVLLWQISKACRLVLIKMGRTSSQAETISQYAWLGMTSWLLILAALAMLEFFTDFQNWPPKIMVAVIPPVALIVYLLFSKRFSRFLKHLPENWLLYLQTFRLPLEIVLWLGFLGGFFPFQMTFEGFNYDIIVGLTGYMAGLVFFGHHRYRRFEAIIWNGFGLILLINIIVISFYSTPSPFRIFMNEPANQMIAYFPFIWIPGFLVPLALALHLFSLKQLLFMPKNNRRTFTLRKK